MVIPPGSLVPTAYGYVISEKPGEKIAACVGIGFSSDTFGVIMEYAGKGSKEDAEAKIKAMLESAFAARNMPLVDVKLASTEHVVQKTGCAFAAVALWSLGEIALELWYTENQTPAIRFSCRGQQNPAHRQKRRTRK